AGTTASLDVMNKYFTISNMPLVSSSYWNMVHGNSPEEVRQDTEGLQTMRNLGKNMAWLLKCIEAGRAAGIGEPQLDSGNRTNFIR
ncbi:MAG: flavodoxin family protein, partial [Oscillospiraceae bacterium]|nr:flavodoxin family protein [Oscillospiraceae bacterium]